MRLEHLLSGEIDCLLVYLEVLGNEGLGLTPNASLLLMFIKIEKDEAERRNSDSLKPVL